MKYFTKWMVAACVSMAGFCAHAQQEDRIFKSFRVDAAMSYVKPERLANRYAFGFSLEPRYGITDNFWAGLRLESAILIQSTPQYNDDYQALGIFSALPTFDYSYVANERFRPFIGIGAGPYFYRQFYDGIDAKEEEKTIRTFGFCPRIGFDYNTFRLSLEYNRLPQNGTYTAIKMGWSMGGGLRD